MDTEKVSKLRIPDKGRNRPARNRLGKRLAGLGLCGLVAVAAFLMYDRGMLTSPPSVEVVTVNWVYPSQVITEFNASGYVVAQRKAAVASKGTGRLEHLAVREGSRVKEGDVLARLENEDIKAEMAQIQAQLAAARADLIRTETDVGASERNFRRFSNLWNQKAIAKADFENALDQRQRSRAARDSARANIKALEAGLRRSTILIEYTIIRAPFDGVVLTKDADEGEVVAPFGSSLNAKAAVVTMADLSSLMVQADVSESSLPKVREGQPCEVQLDALPDSRLSGKVYTIVPTADRTRGTVLVKVRFDVLDPRVLPEMSARVAFLSRPLDEHERQSFLALHRDALAQHDGDSGLFRIEKEDVHWIPLREPKIMGDFIRLDGTWKAGEKAVRKPSNDLKDGDRVSLPE
jgi:RND family efflux transporter MFP subunit